MTQPSAPHDSAARTRYGFFITSCLLFAYILIMTVGIGPHMLSDADPLWHIAAGDLIRATRSIPLYDTWSFTTHDYRWLDISWAWDSVFSYLHERLGWHGAIAANAAIFSLTATLIYVNSRLRSHDDFAALISTVAALTLISIALRPLQVTYAMTALWMLLLGIIARGQLRCRWLAVLPMTMLPWVNCHGGFVVGGVLIAGFFLQALYDRNFPLARTLVITGTVTLAAMFCNPYGIGIIEAVRRPLLTHANQFIDEWQPVTLSPVSLLHYIYAACFILLVPRRILPCLPVERWLAYLWLLLGITSIRHLPIFTVISAPLMASTLHQLMTWRKPSAPSAFGQRVGSSHAVAASAFTLCLFCLLWLPGPTAGRLYQQEHPTPAQWDMSGELDFIRQHYPGTRFFSSFNLGSVIAYQTRGKIPIFIDPRTETAFPPAVINDYISILNATPGWEDIFDRYDMDGAILSNEDDRELISRLSGRKGWKQVFTGTVATIFARTP